MNYLAYKKQDHSNMKLVCTFIILITSLLLTACNRKNTEATTIATATKPPADYVQEIVGERTWRIIEYHSYQAILPKEDSFYAPVLQSMEFVLVDSLTVKKKAFTPGYRPNDYFYYKGMDEQKKCITLQNDYSNSVYGGTITYYYESNTIVLQEVIDTIYSNTENKVALIYVSR